MHIFDEKYLPAYWVTCVSLVGLIFHGLFYPLNLVIQLKERVEINLYSRVVVVFSLLGGIYAMKHWGIVGVAAATVTGELLKNIFMLFMLRRFVAIRYARNIFFRYGGIIAVILIGFIPFIEMFSSMTGILAGTFLFAVLWLVLMINLHPLNGDELGRLEDLLTSSSKMNKIL